MEIKKYNQMMKHLTREKEPTIRLPVTEYDEPIEETKPKVRQETMPERIDRVVYQYDSPAGMKKPKHMDNKNIKTFEEMQTVNKVIDYSPNKTKRPVYKGMELWEEKKKTKVEPIKIDIEGISNSLTKYIETILGIKA